MSDVGVWFALEAGFNGDDSFDALGEEFGPGGPLAVITVMGHAKMQGRGRAKMTFRQLALAAWLEGGSSDASQIMERANALGLLEGYEATERGFKTGFARWEAWQEKLGNAQRQARHRAKRAAGTRDASQEVTEQDSTEQDSTPPKPPEEKRRKVAGRVVTDEEWELTTSIIDAFNAAAGSRYTAKAHFKAIVGRIREHPNLTAAQHRKIIDANFRDPWWSDRPGPQVIYGNEGQFERALEAAREAHRKKRPGSGRRAKARAQQEAELGGASA